MAKGKVHWLYSLESALLDLRFRLRGEENPKAKVGVLAIDEKSIQAFGSYPVPRKYIGKALKNLKKNWRQLGGF